MLNKKRVFILRKFSFADNAIHRAINHLTVIADLYQTHHPNITKDLIKYQESLAKIADSLDKYIAKNKL